MKIVHLSTNESNAGAAKAAFRIHEECLINNMDSKFLVQKKISNHQNTIDIKKYRNKFYSSKINSRLNAFPLKAYKLKEKNNWSPSFFSYANVNKIKEIQEADIIVIYWICEGYLSISGIKKLLDLNKPIIWRFSDMWPFTGGCHYSYGCSKYSKACFKCPELNSSLEYDLSKIMFNKKIKLWNDTSNLTIVTPSKWLMNSVKKSHIFKNTKTMIIPTGVDINIFKEFNKTKSRLKLGLPEDKKLLLFGAVSPYQDRRKGGSYLLEALQLFKDISQTNLVTFGSNKELEKVNSLKNHNLGYVSSDEKMALIYSSCDVFIAPAIEENLANTVLEAMACGTVVVAFNVGGMSDAIDHKVNGYLAEPNNVLDLKNGIDWALKNSDKVNILAREKIENKFSQKIAIQRYRKLYLDVLDK